MPPIRTPKSTITAFFSPLPTPAPASGHASRPRKPCPAHLAASGPTAVTFDSDMDWEKRAETLNHSMRKIAFKNQFNMTDQHIDDMVALGTRLWRRLTHFEFYFHDVNSGSKNSAAGLTDQGLTRLAELCPNLRVVQLQGTDGISDAALVPFFRNCPHLTTLELSTGTTRCASKLTGSALDELREAPGWAPKLKTLKFVSVDGLDENRPFMKAMRALGKERPKLTIYIGSIHEIKKWGDWELETYTSKYRKGRKQ